ncbi:unnamed protein product [Ilex paraguariensis]|uniref:Large ribosomal subunit protein bL33c n=1 Tax=Ilex paraguariensis TaxID=185542 RepID=A0ABC8SIB0_9AQUA
MGDKKKQASMFIRLVSAAGTGFFYVKRKNPRRIPTKLEFRKYDPRVNRHVLFTEAKMNVESESCSISLARSTSENLLEERILSTELEEQLKREEVL